MIKRLIVLIALLVIGFTAKAQVDHQARYESIHERSNLDYIVIPNEDQGVLLVKPVVPSGADDFKIEFLHLGLDLEEKWEGTLELDTRASLQGYYYAANVTYLMFQVRSDSRFIRIVTINTSTKEINTFEPKQILDLSISEFEVINGSAVIGGYVEQRPAVYVYNMEKDEVYTLSHVYQNDARLYEVKINSDSVTFNVLVSQFDEKRDKTVLVSTYDYGGNAIRSYQLDIDINYQLLSAVSSSINDKSQVVVGVYGVKVGTYPSGIFINHVDRTGQQTMRYMNFGEFDTFLNHTGKKRSAKMKAKALKSKAENKDWRYKIDVLFREMMEENGRLIISGEFFKPWTVGTNNIWRNRNQFRSLGGTGFQNNPTNPYFATNPRTFDSPSLGANTEIDFTHAFSLVLDLNGEVQWDGAIDINEDIEAQIDRLGAFQWHAGNAYYAYHYEDELRIKHLNDQEDTEPYVTELKLLSELDKVSKGRGSFIRTDRWYDNTMLVYGIHYVRPSDKSESTRKVFFMNKIALGPNMPKSGD